MSNCRNNAEKSKKKIPTITTFRVLSVGFETCQWNKKDIKSIQCKLPPREVFLFRSKLGPNIHDYFGSMLEGYCKVVCSFMIFP